PSPRVVDAAHDDRRLAGGAADGADRPRAAAAGDRLAMAQRTLPAAAARPVVVDDGDRNPRHGAVRRDADQDLEQRANRAPAAGTGETAARGEDRVAREPDQSALP